MKKKVAIVTGAGSGIGRSIAIRLSKDGFHVIVSDINKVSAEAVAKEIELLGGKSFPIKADVSKKAEVFKMVSTVVDKYNQLDVIVSNAGIAQIKSVTEITEEDLQKIIEVNLFGVIYCLQAASEQMIKQKNGKIINAASITGRRGSAYLSHYAASKFGVVGFTQSAALELGVHGITVNAYCPGVVDTEMWKAIDPSLGKYLDLENGESMNRSANRAALGRKQLPEDLEGTISFLASKDSDFMTGQALVIDGGIIFS